ncbi:MAG: hypothetical protein ACXV2H_09315 [Actinomycetes bacterium]
MTSDTAVDDFLGLNDVPRDRWKRPLIQPEGGGTPEPYMRISSFAQTLDDAGGLVTWKARNAALAMARHPDLAAMVAGLVFSGDKRADRGVNKILDEHVETGIARVTDSAAHGTAVHSFTEPDASPFVPERMQADVASYFQALEDHGLECVIAEGFVVNDALKVAGTFDGIYRHRDLGLLVGDKKTGTLHAQATAVQLACYADSAFYDLQTHARTPLGVRTDVGLVIHIPKGAGKTEIHLIDLEAGRAAAKAALWVCGWRKRDDLLTYLNPLTASEYARKAS